MAKESSFDVVSTVDMQEIDNAYQQAKKELTQRYDLKGSGAELSLDKQKKTITVAAPADFVARQVIDIMGSKLIKRGIDLTAVKWGDPHAATGQSVRQTATIVEGIDKETAGKINKDIKAQKAQGEGHHRGRQAARFLRLPRRASGGHRFPEGPGLRPAAPVRQLPLRIPVEIENVIEIESPRVAFVTMGCAKNEVDTQRMQSQLHALRLRRSSRIPKSLMPWW